MQISRDSQLQREIDVVTNLRMWEEFAPGNHRPAAIFEAWHTWYQRHISKGSDTVNRDRYSDDRLIDLMSERECIAFAKGEATLANSESLFYTIVDLTC